MIFTFGVLQVMGSQRVRHNWVNELNWTDYKWSYWLTPSFSLWAFIYLLDSSLSCLWHYRLSWPEVQLCFHNTDLITPQPPLLTPASGSGPGATLLKDFWAFLALLSPSLCCSLPTMGHTVHAKGLCFSVLPERWSPKLQPGHYLSREKNKTNKQTTKKTNKKKTVFGERFRGQVDSSLFLNLGWK